VPIDVVVVGGGAMGLATAWWLAPQARVVLLERFAAGHHRGASHGDERIYRHLHVGRELTEMAIAADEGWARLERESGRVLRHQVGCVEQLEPADMETRAAAASKYGLAAEWVSAADAAVRWPGMRFGHDVLYQPDGGWVHASATLSALAELAVAGGAELRYEIPVESIDVVGDRARVVAGSTTYDADVVVVTAGAWTEQLVPDVPLPPLLTTEEHVYFFEPRQPLPTFLHRLECTRYGTPGPTGLYKVAEHHTGTVTTADTRTFAPDPDRQSRMEAYVAEWLPALEPAAVSTRTCLYTSTPTHAFHLARTGPIVVGTGFSGQGFKHTPEVARRLATLALS